MPGDFQESEDKTQELYAYMDSLEEAERAQLKVLIPGDQEIGGFSTTDVINYPEVIADMAKLYPQRFIKNILACLFSADTDFRAVNSVKVLAWIRTRSDEIEKYYPQFSEARQRLYENGLENILVGFKPSKGVVGALAQIETAYDKYFDKDPSCIYQNQFENHMPPVFSDPKLAIEIFISCIFLDYLPKPARLYFLQNPFFADGSYKSPLHNRNCYSRDASFWKSLNLDLIDLKYSRVPKSVNSPKVIQEPPQKTDIERLTDWIETLRLENNKKDARVVALSQEVDDLKRQLISWRKASDMKNLEITDLKTQIAQLQHDLFESQRAKPIYQPNGQEALWLRFGGHPLEVLGIKIIDWRAATEIKRRDLVVDAYRRVAKKYHYNTSPALPAYDEVKAELCNKKFTQITEAKDWLEKHLDSDVI